MPSVPKDKGITVGTLEGYDPLAESGLAYGKPPPASKRVRACCSSANG